MVEAVALKAMMDAFRSVPKHEPDTIIMSSFFHDTMKAEIEVQRRFGGRDWRRLKRERRKAHDLVKWKHRHQGRAKFAVDMNGTGFGFWRSTEIKIGDWL